MKLFGSILNDFLKKLVVGFNAKNVVIGAKIEEPQKTPPPTLELSKADIEILLNLIRESHFKGEHVQKIFELVLKLQNHYTNLS